MTLDLDDLKADWRQQAACIGMERIFFPDPSEMKIAEEAKRICRACPVIEDCDEYVLSHRASVTFAGIWAGLSPNDRASRRRSKRGKKVCTGCGISKPSTAFPSGVTSRDGLRTQCRSCKNDYARKYAKVYVKPTRRRICVVCGTVFYSERRKTCSSKCFSNFLSRRPSTPSMDRDCVECETRFWSENRALICSAECRLARIRRQQRTSRGRV